MSASRPVARPTENPEPVEEAPVPAEPQSATAVLDQEEAVELLPIEAISPNPRNQRRSLGDLTDLATSIKSVGVLSPIVVTGKPAPDGIKYTLIFGHRRHAAAKLAGRSTIPAIVRSIDHPSAQVEAMLIENLQRTDLEPVEEAHGYQQLLELGLTQRSLGERIGRSHSHISKRLALLALPKEATKLLEERKLTIEDALELTKLRDHPQRMEKALEAVEMDLQERERSNVSWTVEEELRGLELETKQEEARAKLEQQGIKVFMEPDRAVYHWTPKGAQNLGTGYQELNIAPAKHKKQPCHAAVIQRSDGKARYICTKPANHPELTAPQQEERQTLKQQRAQQEAERAQLEAVQETRRAFIKTVLKRPQREWLKRIVLEFLAEVEQDWVTLELAWSLLGNTVNRAEDLDYFRELTNMCDTEAGTLRAGMAVAFASAEDGYGREFARHLAFLEAEGYKLNPAEREQLKAATEDDEEELLDQDVEDAEANATSAEQEAEPAMAGVVPD